MKSVTILEDVSIPSMPGFRKGQEVRVNDDIADLLVERGHAKFHLGKSRDEVQNEREKSRPSAKAPDVTVKKTS